MAPSASELWTLMKPIHGQYLSSVTFVRDYFQLHFDGPTINVTGAASAEIGSASAVLQSDPRFPGLLRDLIGKEVSGVEVGPDSSVSFRFGPTCVLKVGFPADGGEAIYFHDDAAKHWFVLPS